MARLLIVSRSMALAMRLADQHEVAEHPLDELESLGTELDADVLVLDIGDPIQSVTTVNTLREAGKATPVLLVSGYQPEWEQIEAQAVEGVFVVPLPITRAALLEGVATLLGQPVPQDVPDGEDVVVPATAAAADQEDEEEEEDPPSPAPSPEEQEDDGPAEATRAMPAGVRPVGPAVQQPGPAWGTPVTPGVGLPDFARVVSGDLTPEPAPPPGRDDRTRRPEDVQARQGGAPTPGGSRASRLGNRPRKLQRRPNPLDTQGLGLVTDPLGPRTDPYGFTQSTETASGGIPTVPRPSASGTGNLPTSALENRLDADAAATARSRNRTGGFVMRPADLVQSLLDQAGDLYGVGDTAQVLADDVIERADAGAAAVLVPDGPIWRVGGGVGLRPLERRLVLEASHWLITEIGAAGRAVLIDDTDIIRQQLAGAPLAAWRHLLAVPVPEVRAIVVLARGKDGGPFSDKDLAAVIAPVREAATLLAQAIQTRRLARLLAPLQESDPSAPRRPSETPQAD